MFRVQVHRRAAAYLRKQPHAQQARLKEALKELADNPLGRTGVRSMVGEWTGYHRLRVGDLRVIFTIDEANAIVYVDHIGPRGEIYRKKR